MRLQTRQLSWPVRIVALGTLPVLLSGCDVRGAIREIYVSQHLNAGQAAVLRGDGKTGVAELERVLAVEPDHREAQVYLGQAYAFAKQYAKALPLLERKPLQRRTLDDWSLIADAHDNLGNYDQAEAAYTMAAERSRGTPAYAVALNNLGYMLANRNRKLPQALEALREADRRLPGQGFIVDSLAWALYRLGRYDDALREIDRACELSPWNSELHYHRGMILLELDKEQEAIAAFGMALEIDPDNTSAADELTKLEVDPERYTKRAKGWRKHWRMIQHAASTWSRKTRQELLSPFSTE